MDRLDKEAYENLMAKMTELLTKSEDRIDRTNEMIGKSFCILDKITLEYTKQIEKLQESRDDVVKQNGDLIKLMKKYESQVDSCNKRYDLLLERLLSLAGSNKSENNIKVN